ncbi:MAG: DUF5916 domain-containing protein [Salinibacter sp.]|uniref:DUF5916 domain-containing protein n=1 Tax=Salinibacter sp. TaxID=2065818 RepID=UPI0035D4FF47
MFGVLVTLLSLTTVVAPCDSSGSGSSPDRCALTAQPVSSTVTVDGMLRESGWENAPTATGFRQLEPREGAPASQRTVVRVLYGDDALYVGATLYDDNPDRIRARLARRDQRNQADWFEVSLDSYFDQKTARTFAVNAAGVQRDGIIQGGGGGRGGPLDTSWDALWRSEVRITNDGWTVELRIPYSELRFSQANRQTWGIQFRRRIPRNSEVAEWPLVPSSERRSSLVAQYGTLTNLRNLDSERTIRVAPYTVGRVRTREDPGAPGTMTASSTYDAGANIEVGLSSNTTLNATLNPDFGQVEADPAVLNLSAFETFFPERRPFFVQGTDVFDFRLGREANLLYTRRIGGTAPVIGALKLTGRSRSELTYGVMGATTGHDFSPNRSYVVGRLRQDIGSFSSMGAMLTAFDGPTSEYRRRAFSGGVDWDLRFNENTYQVQGHLSATHRRTTAPDATPNTGLALSTEIGRIQGNWTYDAGFQLRDDDFNPNDVGRLQRNNFFRVSGFLNHQFNGGQPFGPFQSAEGFVFVEQSWSYRNRLSRGLGFFSRFEMLTDGFRSLSLQLDGDKLFGGFDLFETRGLWPRARPRTAQTEISYGTDTRRSWTLEAEVGAKLRSDGGMTWTTSLNSEWNVGSRLKLSGEVSYEIERDAVEWAANEAFIRRSGGRWAIAPSPDADAFTTLETGHDRLNAILPDVPTADDFDDGYHVPVYGARDTERLNFTLRSNLALTRNLSFEFFGQLFAARGRYQDFRILTSPNTFASFSAYPKRHDFATSSFLTNAVLRWEFRPGSELFVVWSQDRRLNRDDPFFRHQQASPYRRSISGRLTDAFEDLPRNTFIVKLRYTFY